MSQRIIKMVIRMPEELHQQLRQLAPERHQSMNAIVVQGLQRELQPVEPRDGQLELLSYQLKKLENRLSAHLEARVPGEEEIESFLRQKYVQRADERQAAMGLSYMEASASDLARELAKFLRRRQ